MKKTKIEPKVLLSTLWIFVMLNYMYCDVQSLMDANLLNQYITGTIEGIQMSESFLLYAAILMEIPIVMILLSRVLGYKSNRITNMIAAAFKTAVMIMSLFVGTGTVSMYYAFYATIEITCTIFIFVYAIRWKEETA